MDEAVDDLESVVRHVAERSADSADSSRVDLLKSAENLSRFPLIGPLYTRDPTGDAREIFARGYRIFYRVLEAESLVEILAV